MNDAPSAATEFARNVPLTGGALYLSFISQYGAAIVTTLAIVYGVMQVTLRILEHRAIMRKNKIDKEQPE
ncbi:Phage Holin [Xylella phage Cota]|uniref:Phage Holin n=1 Tax=Xylella phage Cota TaxID=2699877 RepID=A0A6F8ZL45_9CAUD|nr:Phage Holin [Xylella phage Cota]